MLPLIHDPEKVLLSENENKSSYKLPACQWVIYFITELDRLMIGEVTCLKTPAIFCVNSLFDAYHKLIGKPTNQRPLLPTDC